jgi:hypothetical protein
MTSNAEQGQAFRAELHREYAAWQRQRNTAVPGQYDGPLTRDLAELAKLTLQDVFTSDGDAAVVIATRDLGGPGARWLIQVDCHGDVRWVQPCDLTPSRDLLDTAADEVRKAVPAPVGVEVRYHVRGNPAGERVMAFDVAKFGARTLPEAARCAAEIDRCDTLDVVRVSVV